MKKLNLKNRLQSFWKDESGQGTAEYVMLIMIVVAIVVIFKQKIKDAIDKITWLSNLFHIDHCPLSGIVISGNKPLDESVLKYINDNQIPVVRTDLDTYEAVIKISKIEVKINQNTPWKVQKAIKLIEENVDLEYIIQSKDP